MSESKHTPGKLMIKPYRGLSAICLGNQCICKVAFTEYAERLIKCWNSHDAQEEKIDVLLDVIRNALVSLAIIQMPIQEGSLDVATNDDLLKIMAESFKAALELAEKGKQ